MLTKSFDGCPYDTDWIKTYCVQCDAPLTEDVVGRYEVRGNFCTDCNAKAASKAFRKVRLGIEQ